jgi:hypothetical protein
MAQNTSTAVMQRRVAGTDWLDLYPTPPWATRALCEWLRKIETPHFRSCWEPAAGLGDMVKPLKEYFLSVYASDVHPHKPDYDVADFLWSTDRRADWIVTNPPFKLAEQFATTALQRASRGVALLVRIAFLEGVGRHAKLFSTTPPTDVLQFTERVVMHHGKLSKEGSTATAYCWLVWDLHNRDRDTRFHWIAPCRKRLERDSDFETCPARVPEAASEQPGAAR